MLRKLQQEQKEWSNYNFSNRTNYQPLLGIVEEVGELAHAHLKFEQNVRINEDHLAKKKDAIGDIVIFLSDYCTMNNIDFQEAVELTWNDVKTRDWIKYPKNGKIE